MQKQYQIEGMTCGGCVASVQKKLSSLEKVQSAEIKLEHPQGKVSFSEAVSIDVLQSTLGQKYNIQEIVSKSSILETEEELPVKSINTYKPLILIVAFIAGTSLLSQYPFSGFSGMLWMRHFMSGFFIVFAFFKLLNLEGFASSYSMYDIIAARSKSWGYIYPFLELGLGIWMEKYGNF